MILSYIGHAIATTLLMSNQDSWVVGSTLMFCTYNVCPNAARANLK